LRSSESNLCLLLGSLKLTFESPGTAFLDVIEPGRERQGSRRSKNFPDKPTRGAAEQITGAVRDGKGSWWKLRTKKERKKSSVLVL
jgi:hypothetical protein